SRVGVLLFVRTLGEEIFAGNLTDSYLSQTVNFLNQKPISVFATYSNQGNTYLNPYGYIEFKNLITRSVILEPVEPWFVLPNSLRTREVVGPTLAPGMYTVKILMNRGYDNIIDESKKHYLIRLDAVTTSVLGSLVFLLVIILIFKIKKKYV
ncbi:MAG: hypothetical protein WDZ73_01670, partial [Candidatus Paceibacterota bacterium]